MIRGAAFCPQPPLLVPEVARGAAPELDDLRAACRSAIRRVVTPGTRLIVIGGADAWRQHGPTARGTLAEYGVDLEITLGADAAGPLELPLSLTVGAWLLRDALGPGCGATGWSVGPGDHEPLRLDAGADHVLLVMGDGSARRSTSAPGYLDERAAGFDAGVAAALASGDTGGLEVDRTLAAELLAAGAPAWGAAAALLAPAAGNASPPAFDAELLYDAAPYGVGYFVAAWTARP